MNLKTEKLLQWALAWYLASEIARTLASVAIGLVEIGKLMNGALS